MLNPDAPALVANDSVFSFTTNDVSVTLDMTAIPGETRLDLLRSQIQSYVSNRISTAESVAKKANADWDRYESASANDPLQTLVAKPTKDKETVDRNDVALKAIQALYEGKFVRRDGSTPKKQKERKDPLVTHITRTVVQELFEQRRKSDPSYKYPTASKEVGPDGIAYLKARIDARIAAGEDAKVLNDFLETKYLKPARLMLGLESAAPRFKDFEGIL